MQINNLTFEQLPMVVFQNSKALKRIEDLLTQIGATLPNSNEPETPINIDTVSEITGYSKATLYIKVSKREIPFYKRGSRLFFKKSEIIDWMTKDRKKTVKEIKADALNSINETKKTA